MTGKVDYGLYAWNELYLNGKKYCFDVTWYDVGDYYEYPDDLRYTYFTLYPEEIAKDN